MERFREIIFWWIYDSCDYKKSAIAKVSLDVSLRDLVLASIETIDCKCFDAQELYAYAPIFKVCVAVWEFGGCIEK